LIIYLNLPLDIRLSEVLTGNDLARIAMLPKLPDTGEIEKMKKSAEIKKIFHNHGDNNALLKKKIHLFAKKMIEKGNIEDAFKILLILYN